MVDQDQLFRHTEIVDRSAAPHQTGPGLSGARLTPGWRAHNVGCRPRRLRGRERDRGRAMKIDIVDDKFSFGGENFVVDTASKGRRLSDSEAFTLVKSKVLLNTYLQLAKQIKPASMLELGVFQGGSYVLLDKMFNPNRISAVEISDKPIEPLVDYVSRTPGRTVHFATSQADEIALTRILAEDLGGTLDLVIDDASHAYDMTKRSFEILWPRLSPGGIYVIEDWAWAHQALYQKEGAPRHGKPALTNLIFELVMLMGSNLEIAEMRITKPVVVLKKLGDEALARKNAQGRASVWDGMLLRGAPIPNI
jgi:predicted O-methyltransferase YrrM